MVAGGNGGDPWPYALDHTPSLVAQNTGELALGVRAPQSVGIGVADPRGQDLGGAQHTCNVREMKKEGRK